MHEANPHRFTTLLAVTCVTALAANATADIFQFDLVFETDLIAGVFEFSDLVEGVDDSDPDEPWENFSLADDGPWSLASDDPFLTVSGSSLQQAYGPTFGMGGMTIDIENLIGADYTGLQLDWTLTGPEWNHDTISGTGAGVILDGFDSYGLTVTSWSVTLVPTPVCWPAGLLATGLVRRRRS